MRAYMEGTKVDRADVEVSVEVDALRPSKKASANRQPARSGCALVWVARVGGLVVEALVNLDWGLDASAAVEVGRVHDQLFPMIVDTDNVYPPEVVEDLRQRGHNMTSAYCAFFARGNQPLTSSRSVADIKRVAAVVQVITKKDGVLYGECGRLLS